MGSHAPGRQEGLLPGAGRYVEHALPGRDPGEIEHALRDRAPVLSAVCGDHARFMSAKGTRTSTNSPRFAATGALW